MKKKQKLPKWVSRNGTAGVPTVCRASDRLPHHSLVMDTTWIYFAFFHQMMLPHHMLPISCFSKIYFQSFALECTLPFCKISLQLLH